MTATFQTSAEDASSEAPGGARALPAFLPGVTEARAAELLLQAMRELSRTRCDEAIGAIACKVARALLVADGATFVRLRGEACCYLAEDAIEPLWKGRQLPARTCLSGWVMAHAQQVSLPDIYADPRVSEAVYRPTFIKSLVMTPVRRVKPLAAIGVFWANERSVSERELLRLQDLADAVAVALENAEVHAELERRVEERSEQLMQVNRELEAFSYSVAHDLRSPLSVILGFAELIEDRVVRAQDDSVSLFASEITVAGKRMNALIGALLEFSRCARATLEKSRVDLSAQARAVADRLLAELPNACAEIAIEPGLQVHADPVLLDIVLTNVLGNALKYSSKRERPRIVVGQLSELHAPTFFVRDNGAGFDPTLAEQLFVPFQRLHSKREFCGTGVGLAMVARIVRRHGGRIWAEGELDRGATFYFTLPDGEAPG